VPDHQRKQKRRDPRWQMECERSSMPAGPTLRTVAPVFSRGGSQAGSALVLRRPFPVGPARLRNGHAHGVAITFPAGPERRRADRCWVSFHRRYSDRARRADGRSDAIRPSHTGQVDEGWLDFILWWESSPRPDYLPNLLNLAPTTRAACTALCVGPGDALPSLLGSHYWRLL